MAISTKVKTAKGKTAKVKSAKAKTAGAKTANAKSGDNDGGAGPTGPPKGKKTTAQPHDAARAISHAIPATVMAKAAAIGAHNAGAGPALGQNKPGAPVRFVGTVQSTAADTSAGAAPDYLFGKTS